MMYTEKMSNNSNQQQLKSAATHLIVILLYFVFSVLPYLAGDFKKGNTFRWWIMQLFNKTPFLPNKLMEESELSTELFIFPPY